MCVFFVGELFLKDTIMKVTCILFALNLLHAFTIPQHPPNKKLRDEASGRFWCLVPGFGFAAQGLGFMVLGLRFRQHQKNVAQKVGRRVYARIGKSLNTSRPFSESFVQPANLQPTSVRPPESINPFGSASRI